MRATRPVALVLCDPLLNTRAGRAGLCEPQGHEASVALLALSEILQFNPLCRPGLEKCFQSAGHGAGKRATRAGRQLTGHRGESFCATPAQNKHSYQALGRLRMTLLRNLAGRRAAGSRAGVKTLALAFPLQGLA